MRMASCGLSMTRNSSVPWWPGDPAAKRPNRILADARCRAGYLDQMLKMIVGIESRFRAWRASGGWDRTARNAIWRCGRVRCASEGRIDLASAMAEGELAALGFTGCVRVVSGSASPPRRWAH